MSSIVYDESSQWILSPDEDWMMISGPGTRTTQGHYHQEGENYWYDLNGVRQSTFHNLDVPHNLTIFLDGPSEELTTQPVEYFVVSAPGVAVSQIPTAIGYPSAGSITLPDLGDGGGASPDVIDEDPSILTSFFEGATTGMKAVANSWTGNLGSMATLGFMDPSDFEVFEVTQADLDRGYETSLFIADVGVAAATAVVGGGAGCIVNSLDNIKDTVTIASGIGHAISGQEGGPSATEMVGAAVGLGLNFLMRGNYVGCFVAGTQVHVEGQEAFHTTGRGITLDPLTATLAIEQVTLGQRVLTQNPVREDYDWTSPDPDRETWCEIHFRCRKADGSTVELQHLRPRSIVENLGLFVGQELDLHLTEFELDGGATVTAIRECPEIIPGDGSVVTGLIRTVDEVQLAQLVLASGEIITGTPNHPVWSLDRHAWTAIEDLESGELLQGEAGPVAVVSVSLLEARASVYNLEIHGEHVYQIGIDGVVVHNACIHKHHAIPKEILRKLPPQVRNDKRIKSFTGDNKRLVEAGLHEIVHNKKGISIKATGIRGGAYNLRFHEEILKLPDGYRFISVQQVLNIRNKLIAEFGI